MDTRTTILPGKMKRVISVALLMVTVLIQCACHCWLFSGRFTFCPFSPGEEDDLSLLTALLEENESALDCSPEESHPLSQEDGEPDAYDELFDADGDGESYSEETPDGELGETEERKENLATLFGDMEDLTDEEEVPTQQSPKNRVLPAPAPNQGKTNQELQGALTTCFSNFFKIDWRALTVFTKIAAKSGWR